jgi:hypothetical protein
MARKYLIKAQARPLQPIGTGAANYIPVVVGKLWRWRGDHGPAALVHAVA